MAVQHSRRSGGGGGERVKKIFPASSSSLITEDCAALRRKFLAKHSTSFSAFKLSWEELSFHTIFSVACNRKIKCGIMLVECLYEEAKKWLSAGRFREQLATPTGRNQEASRNLPEEIVRVKLAGLYLIWCVFYSQSYNQKVMARVTLELWKEICWFHTQLKEMKYHESDYILSTLKADSAFLICFSDIPMCVPAHLSTLTKEQLMSLILTTPSSPTPSIIAALTNSEGTGKTHSPSTSEAGQSSGERRSLASMLCEGCGGEGRQECGSVRVDSLTSKLEEYSSLKQQLSVFLPHHLLTQSTLPQQLQQLYNN